MSTLEDATDDEELLLLLTLFSEQLSAELEERIDQHIREQRRRNRRLPKRKDRPTWRSFVQRVSRDHFRRMFRMALPSFERLCDDICTVVSEEVFRPEAFLLNGGFADKPGYAALQHQGGHVPGEIRAATSLRLLAGGSYLDLVPLFDVAKSQVYDSFDIFLKWVIRTYKFPLTDWLRTENWLKLHELARAFAEKTGGLMHGGFGSLDGLALRIMCPSKKDVPDGGNCCCRKGFYALNVQATCDKKKRFLWVNPSNKGSTHDSTAFGCSKLFDLLCEKSNDLKREGLCLHGDSAYPLTPFLQVPYELPELQNDPAGAKDAFNYFHSSNGIYVECAFGEFVMRWGVFWRSLRFDLRKCGLIIQAAMLLHNFIIDEGHGYDEFDRSCFENFSINRQLESQRRQTQSTGEQPRALVSDNNEPRPAGRRSDEERQRRDDGERIRNGNVLLLATHSFRRPMHSNMRMNAEGHIYMDY